VENGAKLITEGAALNMKISNGEQDKEHGKHLYIRGVYLWYIRRLGEMSTLLIS
jgi:hypothetical protein